MKIKLCVSLAACLFFTNAVSIFSQGYIIPNGVTYIGLNFFGAYETRIIQNPTNSDYTGIFLQPQGNNSFLFSTYVDEGVRTFFVSSNQPVDRKSVV